MSTITYAVWALAAGSLIPLMAILNAGLARATGGTIQATVILFSTGLIASLVLAATTKAHIPAIQTLARIAPSQYVGGVIVGFYILSITFLAPRFGVGNAILFAVTAQLLTSAFIDHFAWAGAAPRPLTTMRAMGLLIVVVGVVITQVSDRTAAGAANPPTQ
ncbi:MAG: DMT family transporter [Steroidobacteraceae bacterium]